MAKPEFDPRRAEPGQAFAWHDEWGKKHEVKADDEGVLRPRNETEVRIADAFDLPRARVDAAPSKPRVRKAARSARNVPKVVAITPAAETSEPATVAKED